MHAMQTARCENSLSDRVFICSPVQARAPGALEPRRSSNPPLSAITELKAEVVEVRTFAKAAAGHHVFLSSLSTPSTGLWKLGMRMQYWAISPAVPRAGRTSGTLEVRRSRTAGGVRSCFDIADPFRLPGTDIYKLISSSYVLCTTKTISLDRFRFPMSCKKEKRSA